MGCIYIGGGVYLGWGARKREGKGKRNKGKRGLEPALSPSGTRPERGEAAAGAWRLARSAAGGGGWLGLWPGWPAGVPFFKTVTRAENKRKKI